MQAIRQVTCFNGEIIDLAEQYIFQAKTLLPDVPNKQDLDMINDFLLAVRKDFW